MSRNLGATFWSPLFLAFASAALAIVSGSTTNWDSITVLVAGVLTVVFVVAAYVAAKLSGKTQPTGGAGGNAEALGEDSDAEGGGGGRSIIGRGGDGGTALTTGAGSRARGGRGGDA